MVVDVLTQEDYRSKVSGYQFVVYYRLVRGTVHSLFASAVDFHLAEKSHELKSGQKVGRRRRYPKGPIGIDGASV